MFAKKIVQKMINYTFFKSPFFDMLFAKLVQSVTLCHRLSKKLNFIKI